MYPKGATIHLLDRGRVMAEYGPMQLLISAAVGSVPQVGECVRAAKQSFGYLEEVASVKDCLFCPWGQVSEPIGSRIGLDMLAASRAVGDHDLTPMAAVAGAIADAVARFLMDRGMTRVVVSNGGDVAVKLREGQEVRIGIGGSQSAGSYVHRLVLDGSRKHWGIATSGLGGRSFTKGIASRVTVLSGHAAYADAAATAVANATYVEDPEVQQVPAERLDPNTDICGELVTVRVGRIGVEKIDLAMARAKAKAHELMEKGVIFGAFVVVKEKVELIGSLPGINETPGLCAA